MDALNPISMLYCPMIRPERRSAGRFPQEVRSAKFTSNDPWLFNVGVPVSEFYPSVPYARAYDTASLLESLWSGESYNLMDAPLF